MQTRSGLQSITHMHFALTQTSYMAKKNRDNGSIIVLP